MDPWVTKPLYGGAISTVFPQKFLDVSMLRQVPDTQEVFVNSRTETEAVYDGLGFNESIIIDLLERVDETDDMQALHVHLGEISALDGAQKWDILKSTQNQKNVINSMVVEVAYKWGKKSLQDTVVMCVGLIRLEQYSTDVVISIIIPTSSECELQSLETAMKQKNSDLVFDRLKAAWKLLNAMTDSFKVHDPTLFV